MKSIIYKITWSVQFGRYTVPYRMAISADDHLRTAHIIGEMNLSVPKTITQGTFSYNSSLAHGLGKVVKRRAKDNI